ACTGPVFLPEWGAWPRADWTRRGAGRCALERRLKSTNGRCERELTPWYAIPPGREARWECDASEDGMGCWTLRCAGCGEWLPADTEFWYRAAGHNYPRARCKACCDERKQHERRPNATQDHR